MKKTIRLMIFYIAFTVLLLSGCTNNKGVEKEEKVTVEDLQALVFDDASFEYDGKLHGIYIENIYEDKGVSINYTNNDKKDVGSYNVTAYIKFEDLSITKRAKLTIVKGNSSLKAEPVQNINIFQDDLKVYYELSNDEQEVHILNESGNRINISTLNKTGSYKLKLYAPATASYKESNYVEVTFNVVKSNYGVEFKSLEVEGNGEEHTLLLEGTLPEGFSVEYVNNVGTEVGKYFATANIKDSTGNIVETQNAVLIIESSENEEFNKYLDEFFVEYLEEDQLSVNIFCEDPSKFGLEHYEAEWYTYETFGDEEIEHDLNIFKEMLAELELFKDEELSNLQQVAYKTIESFLNYYIEYYSIEDSFISKIIYIDQFGGYVADFGTYMEAYSLRSELEVQDIVKYIQSTEKAFPSYLVFANEKIEKGYPLSNYTIDEMRKYLEDILTDGESYYLKDILNEKIDNVDFLDAAQKEDYKNQVAEAIKNSFIPAVQELYDGLEACKDKLSPEQEGYYATYENGKEIYMLELQNLLGLEFTADEYIKILDDAMDSTIDLVIETQTILVQENNITSWAHLESIVNKNAIFKGTPEEMLEYLKEFAKTIVPDLKSDPEIVVKEMDEASAKVSNAVAYYMKSALDNTSNEFITLNPVKLGDSSPNDVLGTLAHEGYPGHLYAYVFSKELELSNIATIMTSTAHAEGWATYVQLKLYEDSKLNSNNAQFQQVMNYLYANQLSGYLLETRIDAGIHLQGWGVNEVAMYMDNLGYSSDSAEEIYNLIIEMPTQYAAYGYGKLVFCELHDEAKEILGKFYDEIEFNEMLLSKGWTDLGILYDTYNEYMEIKCYEVGLEFNK